MNYPETDSPTDTPPKRAIKSSKSQSPNHATPKQMMAFGSVEKSRRRHVGQCFAACCRASGEVAELEQSVRWMDVANDNTRPVRGVTIIIGNELPIQTTEIEALVSLIEDFNEAAANDHDLPTLDKAA